MKRLEARRIPSRPYHVDLRIPEAASTTYDPRVKLGHEGNSILGGAAVLLVSDDARQLYRLSRIVRAGRAVVATATSAAECLIRALAQRPEVIVVDASGTDVVALERSLGELVPNIPLIVTSEQPIDARLRATPLRKPFTISDLFATLERVLLGRT